jgi:hypothetical protein
MVKSFNTISALALAALAQANYVPEYVAPPTPDYAAPPAADYAAPPTYDTPAYVPVISSTTCTTETDYPVPTGYVAPPTYDTPDDGYHHEPTAPADYGHPTPTDVYGHHKDDYDGHKDDNYDGYHKGKYHDDLYVSVYTSCEVVPTVYIKEGVECTTEYTKTHELTTTCETPVETPCPTTITKSYETTYSTCITYPTTCETEGTTYVTHTSSTQYSTATVCTTEVYEPKPTTYATSTGTTDVYAPPAAPTGYPVVKKPTNQTSYVPTYPVSTGGASLNGPTLVAFAAVFGGLVAALF